MQTTILSSLKCALLVFLVAPVLALAADKVTKNSDLIFKPGKTETQTRSIEQNEIHDIFFQAKKDQKLTIKISSTGGTARFELSAMFKLDTKQFQAKTTEFSGKLPESGTGEYVIRVESDKATSYTLTATLK